MTDSQKNGKYCKECENKKIFFKQFCIFCLKKTNSNIFISVSDTITVRDSLKLRLKGDGFKKFISETLSGWFPSGDKRLKHGVDKVRSIDKKTDEYHEVVKNYRTGKIIHECHEPLSVHHNKKYE